MSIHFDDAWFAARDLAEELAGRGDDIVLLRDLRGRVSIVVGRACEINAGNAGGIADRLREVCGPFCAAEPLLLAEDLFAPHLVLRAPELTVVRSADPDAGAGSLSVLEAGITGRDWLHPADPARNRVALYGFKGGVGRTTAAVLLAHHLASNGLCVLVADLDLESPGLSEILLEPDDLPDHGVVDHLIEQGVGNARDLMCVAPATRFTVRGNGEIWVAPARGRSRDGYTYLPKLNRIYRDDPLQDPSSERGRGSTFAGRLAATIDRCEELVERNSRPPDVVLLDSRAGVHDIAAVAITRLADLSLLFAADTRHTWNGYRDLFSQWRQTPETARAVRERLRMVASMVPADRAGEYLEGFRDRAHLLFAQTLYDTLPEGSGVEDSHPSVEDTDAPHSPLPIQFTRDLTGTDVTEDTRWLEQTFVRTAFGDFLDRASCLIVEDLGPEVARTVRR